MKRLTKEQREVRALGYKVHANSPYNDGWTREFYQKQYEQEIKKMKKYEQNRSKQAANKQ